MGTILGYLGAAAIFGGVIALCNLPGILHALGIREQRHPPGDSDSAGPGGWGSR